LHDSFAWPAPLVPTPGKTIAARDDNPNIPSGFTYLLQFVGHDLVNTQTPFWQVQNGLGTANLQSHPLRLSVLYGGGPAACPIAYAPAGLDGQDRCSFRLNTFKRVNPPVISAHLSDLSRVVADGCTETLVADTRNADNAVLSQLTTLFALLHNAVAEAISANTAFAPGASSTIRQRAVFEQARSTVEQIYRRLVLGELLDKILHPSVLAAYRASGASIAAVQHVPLELTHAVLRCGHTMVRDRYFLRPGQYLMELADNLAFAGPALRGQTQIPPVWIVQWSSFFEMNISGVSPNYSRRIGPGMSPQMFDPTSFQPIGEQPPLGLPYRDMKSGLLAGLWSVDALITEVATRAPGLLPAGWMFASPVPRAAAVSGWLTTVNRTQYLGLTAADIATVAADPPLSIFVLLEAALDPAIEGQHLGVLASIIFADVLFGIAAAVRPPAASALPPAEQTAVDAIATMADCVRYVAAHITVPPGGISFI
jgi:hypothetical protein